MSSNAKLYSSAAPTSSEVGFGRNPTVLLSRSALLGHSDSDKTEGLGEVGEEVETRSGASSHVSTERGVAVQTEWLRELREEQGKRECLENSVQLLRQELRYLQHHTAQLAPSLLSLQRRPICFHEPSFLRSLQDSVQHLVWEVEQWQTHSTPTWLQSVDLWRLTVARAVPGAQVKVWGSLAVTLHLPCSAVDVLVMHSELGERETLDKIQQQCQLEGISTELLSSCPVLLKVPLQFAVLHVSVLSPAHKGFQRTTYMRKAVKGTPLLRPVYLTLKHIWTQCQVLDVSVGGPGAYGLFLMTAALLQRETGSAAYLVYRFFQYYGYECDYSQTICLTHVPVALTSPALAVLDPSAADVNLTAEADLGGFVVRSRQDFTRLALSSLLTPASCTCAVACNLLLKALLEMQRWFGVQTP